MSTMQLKYNPTKCLTPLTPAQMKDVQDLIAYTEANRKPLRKPRIRKRDPNSTPRPVNCFLVYRREKQAQIAELCVGANHRVISKIVARWWENIDEHTKALYVDVAKQVKIDHAIKFPGYKYAPKRKQNSTIQECINTTKTQPVTPANLFFMKLEENNLAEQSTAIVKHQSKSDATSSFDCNMTKQFIDMLCDPQSFPVQQGDANNAPLLSQPLVDDSMAQYMDAQQWQIDNGSNTAFNQVMVPPHMALDTPLDTPATTTSAAGLPDQGTNWAATINPQTTMIQQHDAIHPLDLGDQSNPLDFSALGCGMDDVFWPLDTTPFITENNNNMLDMMCTPDLLAENDSPLSVPSSYYRPVSHFYGSQSDFVHPAAAIKAVTSSSSL